MTEEELTEHFWETVNEAIKHAELPKNVKIRKTKDFNLSFHMQLESSEVGKIVVNYQLPFELLKQHFKNVSNDTSDIKICNFKLYHYVRDIIESFVIEVENNFVHLHTIANLYHKYFGVIDKEGNILIYEELDKQVIKSYINARSRHSRAVIRKFIYQRKNESIMPRGMTVYMAYFYDVLLPVWQAAKKFYKKNKYNENCLEELNSKISINLLYMDTSSELPHDLLNKLSDKDSYESSASALALEHAARICLIPPNSLEKRSHETLVQKSRQWMDKYEVLQARQVISVKELE